MKRYENEKGFYTDRLYQIVLDNPGMDGVGLAGGYADDPVTGTRYNQSVHGSLRAAEYAGVITFSVQDGGWRAVPYMDPRPHPANASHPTKCPGCLAQSA